MKPHLCNVPSSTHIASQLCYRCGKHNYVPLNNLQHIRREFNYGNHKHVNGDKVSSLRHSGQPTKSYTWIRSDSMPVLIMLTTLPFILSLHNVHACIYLEMGFFRSLPKILHKIIAQRTVCSDIFNYQTLCLLVGFIPWETVLSKAPTQ